MHHPTALKSRLLICLLGSQLALAGCLMNEPVDEETSGEEPPVNNAPEISGTPPPMVKVGVNYMFRPSANDPDADTLSFSISNAPGWTDFNSATGELAGMPFLGDEGTYAGIRIAVSDGSTSVALPSFTITVEPDTASNLPPNISGTGAASVTVGNPYSFTPTASDPDGDTLTFSITNRPAWLAFNANTGRISGTPQAGNVGTYQNISITVTDGQLASSTPAFSITVEPDTASNLPPNISGTGAASVTVGNPYSFTPTASDPDGDTLTFSINNRPAWLAFNANTGRISGTPQAGDIGTYQNISITVTDGQLSSSTPAFSITVNQISLGQVTLSWTAPTQNTDGSPLNDLAGYRIYYGTQQGNYPNTVAVNTAGLTTYVVENLAPGTWFFVSTAVNGAGMESEYSNVATKMVN